MSFYLIPVICNQQVTRRVETKPRANLYANNILHFLSPVRIRALWPTHNWALRDEPERGTPWDNLAKHSCKKQDSHLEKGCDRQRTGRVSERNGESLTRNTCYRRSTQQGPLRHEAGRADFSRDDDAAGPLGLFSHITVGKMSHESYIIISMNVSLYIFFCKLKFSDTKLASPSSCECQHNSKTGEWGVISISQFCCLNPALSSVNISQHQMIYNSLSRPTTGLFFFF